MNLYRSWLPGAIALVLMGLCSTGPLTKAQPKKDAKPAQPPVVDAWRIEEPWRPSFADVLNAKAALVGQTPDQLGVANALRVLANRADDSAKAAPQHRLAAIPELGTGGADLKAAPELALRLAALLRGGFPATGTLAAETLLFLDSPAWASGSRFSPALLDLLVCDAVCTRQDSEFVTLQAKAIARAKDTCTRLTWTSKAPAAAPDAAALCELACEALCRRFASERGWVSQLPAGWELVVDSLCARVRAGQPLWPEAVPDRADAGACARAVLCLGALLSQAMEEGTTDAAKGKLARRYALAVKTVQREADSAFKKSDLRIDLDGAALLALFTPDMEPDSCKPLQDHLARRLPGYFAAVDFTSGGLNLASALGWVTENPALALPEELAKTYLPPAELGDRHYVAQLSLSLLGHCGGLVPSRPCTPLGTPADFNNWSRALAVLDAANTNSLQDQIGVAIERAVVWLKKQQRADGTFQGGYSPRLGGHCLNVLALLDAGVPRDDACIRKALAALPALETGLPPGQLDGPVYGYAVALLMFQKFYEDEQVAAQVLEAKEPDAYNKATAKVWRRLKPEHRKLISKMVATLTADSHGFGWSYFGLATKDGTAAGFGDNSWRDNSNSQYAVMGLKAASLLGAEFDREILAAEARRLIRYYKPDASMPAIRVKLEGAEDKKRTGADRTDSIVPGGWDYLSATGEAAAASPAASANTGMTAAGVSSLVICRDELQLQGKLDPALKSNIDLHIHGSLHWLGARFGYRYIRGTQMARVYAEGWGKYYDMYSLERAGVLSNVRHMAGVEWYVEGARLLVQTQQADGGWPDIVGKTQTESASTPDIVDQCFAILFLKRAVVPVISKPVITQGD